MKKVLWAILSMVLVLCVGALGTVTVSATNEDARQAEPPPTRLSYINTTATGLSISGGQATCAGTVVGYNGVTTKVVIKLYLERKLASVTTWSPYAEDPAQTFNSWTGGYQMKKAVVSGYQYRTRAVYTAYSGSNSESVTGYSSVVTY